LNSDFRLRYLIPEHKSVPGEKHPTNVVTVWALPHQEYILTHSVLYFCLEICTYNLITFSIYSFEPHIPAVVGALFNLKAHCRTVFSLWDEKKYTFTRTALSHLSIKGSIEWVKSNVPMLKSCGGVAPCFHNSGFRGEFMP
jgi:hypothetical protein